MSWGNTARGQYVVETRSHYGISFELIVIFAQPSDWGIEPWRSGEPPGIGITILPNFLRSRAVFCKAYWAIGRRGSAFLSRIRALFEKIPLRRQRAGQLNGGPLWACLEAMSAVDHNGNPISPAGFELKELIIRRGVSVAFAPLGGEAAAPWRGFIIIDSSLMDSQQSISPTRIGTVAHELTHILQRDINDPDYWPSGFFRINPHTRWFADSTNFMETQAYLLGYCVQYDLEKHKLDTAPLTSSQRKGIESRLKKLKVRMSTLANADALNATYYIVNTFPHMYFYRQNYRKETRVTDHRIPNGTWDYWLKRVGYSDRVIDHIRSIVDEDLAVQVNQQKAEEAATPTSICGILNQNRSGDTSSLRNSAAKQLVTSFNANAVVLIGLVALYLVLNPYWSATSWGSDGVNALVQSSWKWLLWLFIGVSLQSNFTSLRELIDKVKRTKENLFRAGAIVLTLVLVTLCVLILIVTKTSIQFDLSVVDGGVNFGDLPGGFLQLLACATGYFYRLIANTFVNMACIFWEGIIGPIRELLGRE
jgi:hypothetical protein